MVSSIPPYKALHKHIMYSQKHLICLSLDVLLCGNHGPAQMTAWSCNITALFVRVLARGHPEGSALALLYTNKYIICFLCDLHFCIVSWLQSQRETKHGGIKVSGLKKIKVSLGWYKLLRPCFKNMYISHLPFIETDLQCIILHKPYPNI